MRVAIIGAKGADTMEENLREAFSYAGHQCEIFDIYDLSKLYQISRINLYARTLDKLARTYSDAYDSRLFNKLAGVVNEYDPDLVVCVYRFIHPCFVKAVKSADRRVVHINPDALTTFEFQQVFASDYDAWFTKDPYIVHFMRENMHLNAYLYYEAFNSRLHKRPGCSKRECEDDVNIDVMTYGTIYPYRANMLEAVVAAGIDLKIYGVLPHRFYKHTLDSQYQNKYITGVEKSRILYGSKIVFNQMHYAEIEGVNCRFFEVNGSGAFQLSDYRPILHNILPVDPELVSFKTIDEGIEKIKHYLCHPEERYMLSEQIYNHFASHYSYDHLVNYLLSKLS